MTAPTHITDAELADWIAHVSALNPGERCRMTNGVVLRGLRRLAADAQIVAAARAFASLNRGMKGGSREYEDAIEALMAAVDAADAEVTR
jgi:hypothetical protein